MISGLTTRNCELSLAAKGEEKGHLMLQDLASDLCQGLDCSVLSIPT
jgi:hypothetical protein